MMDEVFNYQDAITDSMGKANERFVEIEQNHGVDQTILRVKEYRDKIINLRRSLIVIKEKSDKLRRRGNKILEVKNRQDIERQRSRERREALEKHLEPVVNTGRDR